MLLRFNFIHITPIFKLDVEEEPIIVGYNVRVIRYCGHVYMLTCVHF